MYSTVIPLTLYLCCFFYFLTSPSNATQIRHCLDQNLTIPLSSFLLSAPSICTTHLNILFIKHGPMSSPNCLVRNLCLQWQWSLQIGCHILSKSDTVGLTASSLFYPACHTMLGTDTWLHVFRLLLTGTPATGIPRECNSDNDSGTLNQTFWIK